MSQDLSKSSRRDLLQTERPNQRAFHTVLGFRRPQNRSRAMLPQQNFPSAYPSEHSLRLLQSLNPSLFASSSFRRLRSNSRRSEEHTSELQSLMRISYAVFC